MQEVKEVKEWTVNLSERRLGQAQSAAGIRDHICGWDL